MSDSKTNRGAVTAVSPSRGDMATAIELVKWRTLSILALAMVGAMGLWFSASTVVPPLTQAWNLDENGQAWLTMSVQIGFVVGTLVSALLNLADLVPASRLFGVSAFAAAVANLLIPLAANDLVLALPLRFLTGAFTAGVYPVGMKVVTTWCGKDRGLGIGMLVGALTLGSASPHLIRVLGGFADWRTVLYASSGLAIIGGVLALAWVREGPLSAQVPPFNWRFVARIFQEPSLRMATFGYLGHMWELYAMWTWIPLFLTASFTASRMPDAARWAEVVAFSVIAIGGPASVLAGIWADRWGRTRVAMVSLGCSGSCAVLIGVLFDASPILISALALVWGIAIIADSAQYSASLSELAPREYIGTAMAFVRPAWALTRECKIPTEVDCTNR